MKGELMKVGAILFSEMQPDEAWEGEFNAWYDEEHIPVRMSAPGFLGARRYTALEGKRDYLAVYDMEGISALQTDAYREIKDRPSELTKRMLGGVGNFTRYIGELASWQVQPGLKSGELLGSPILYAVFFTVPKERHEEFDAWYVEDHVPLLLGSADWLGCRRYRIVSGEPENYTHVALHHLRSVDALASPEREAARNTAWRRKLASEPWFKGAYKAFTAHGERFEARPSKT